MDSSFTVNSGERISSGQTSIEADSTARGMTSSTSSINFDHWL